jgi:hypothetical protein
MNNTAEQSTCVVCNADCTQRWYDHYTTTGERFVFCSAAHLKQWLTASRSSNDPQVLPLVHHYAVNVTQAGATTTQYNGRQEHKAATTIQHFCVCPGVEHIAVYRDGRVVQDIAIEWRGP